MFILFCFILMFLFIYYSGNCIPIAAETLIQCFTIVIPSIFPFLVLTEILSKTDFLYKVGKIFEPLSKKAFKISGTAFSIAALGYLSGFPGAAKMSADLYKEKKISYEDAIRLSLFVNNPGPLFMIGTIGIGLLDSIQKGILLFSVQVISSFLTGILLNNLLKIKSIGFRNEKELNTNGIKKSNINIITDSITSAFNTMIPITGTIVFFSFLSEAIVLAKNILPINFEGYENLFNSSIKCFFELSNGLSSIIPEIIDYPILFPLISMICAWSGISIHMQILNFYLNAKIPIKYYLIGKLSNMIVSYFVMFFIITL